MKQYPHLEGCKCGNSEADLPLPKAHPWYVKSKAHHSCFWVYLRHNNRSHTLYEIAQLLNLSISAITSIERKAFTKLRGKVALLPPSEKNS